MKVVFVGGGVMNFALMRNMTHYGAHDSTEIAFWDINPKIKEYFDVHHASPHPYLSELTLNDNVSAAQNLEDLIKGAVHIIIGVPAQKMRYAIRDIAELVKEHQIITIVSKGIELNSYMRNSEIVLEELRKVRGKRYKHPIAVFSGGTTAVDLAYGAIIGAEVAAKHKKVRRAVAAIFNNQRLRVWPNRDVKGVEYSGALKNVISIGAGLAEAVVSLLVKEPSWWKEKYGDEKFGAVGIKSVFVSRAEKDLYAISRALGCKLETFLAGSIAFHGDMNLSCFGHTRNLNYGDRVGRGEEGPPEVVLSNMQSEGNTVEGYYTVKAVYELANKLRKEGKLKVETPCIDAVYNVVYEGMKPLDALTGLMTRKMTEIGMVRRATQAVKLYVGGFKLRKRV